MIPKKHQKYKQKPAECHPDRPLQARGMCKNCYDKWLKSTNPEYLSRQQDSNKKWVKENVQRVRAHKEKWRLKQDPVYNHFRKLKRYNLTVQDYEEMFKKQNGVCAICGRPPSKNKLAVDHCHETGKVRGLLCFRCNFGLSYFSESSGMMHKAAKYLEGAL